MRPAIPPQTTGIPYKEDPIPSGINGDTEAAQGQREAALVRANECRTAFRQLKGELRMLGMKEGAGIVADVTGSCPEKLEGFTIGQMLAAIRYFGATRASQLCRRIKLDPNTRLKEMTKQDRANVIDRLQDLPE